jgi:hypothetical protein
MSDQPRAGWQGFLAGLPDEPAPAPTAEPPQEPQPQEPPRLPDAHNGPRTDPRNSEDVEFAAVMRSMFGR